MYTEREVSEVLRKLRAGVVLLELLGSIVGGMVLRGLTGMPVHQYERAADMARGLYDGGPVSWRTASGTPLLTPLH